MDKCRGFSEDVDQSLADAKRAMKLGTEEQRPFTSE
jgi:hypothetical protein